MTLLTERLNAAAAGEIVWSDVGGSCPMLGWGVTRDGLEVYFRFRNNCAQLYVGKDRSAPVLYAEENDVYSLPDDGDPDELLGTLEDDAAVELVERLRAQLRPAEQWPGGTRHGRMVKAFALLQEQLDKGLPEAP